MSQARPCCKAVASFAFGFRRGVGSGEDMPNERARRRTQARARSPLRPRRPSAAKGCAGVGSKRVMSTPRSGVEINFLYVLMKETPQVACEPYGLFCGSEAAIYRYAGGIAEHLVYSSYYADFVKSCPLLRRGLTKCQPQSY